MPYDPDTDPNTSCAGGYSGATRSHGGHLRTSFNGLRVEHVESEDELGEGSGRYHDYDMQDEPRDDGDDEDDEDDQDDQDDQDEMEIDRPHANLAQTSIEMPRPPPQPSPQSFAPINSITKTSHVAVVLHSSPRRSTYTVLPDEPPSDTQDLDPLVTSDLIPGLKRSPKPFIPRQPTTQQPAPAFVSCLTPQPKKSGRPFGWKAGSGPYSAINSQPGASRPPKPKNPPGEAKRRGRPPKAPSPEPRQIFLSLRPRYVPFYCEWAGCPAELQNLETLRRHIFIVHGDAETCQWASCAARSDPPLDLPTDAVFQDHVDKAHLLPFVWHVGDGPRNSDSLDKAACMRGDADPLPGYLFDAEGRQVTPSVRGQEFENDEERKWREKRLRRCQRQQQVNAPMEADHSEEFKAAMKAANDAKRAKQKGLRDYAESLKKGKYDPEWTECLG
ncbi:hypothetical protein B0T22DRAFT_468861 [Podospora appendiculata]|uniref:C2H2-type domain-containing protein n=1 Tax=Podospora appendiculata TaxID=314037 RepID=A0AAE1C946_9PEZI|nr:hypothetical protein B0T22DRAFT_468861 [Podospora appendiculata]